MKIISPLNSAKPTPPGGVRPADRALRPVRFTVVQTRWDALKVRYGGRTIRSFDAHERAFDAQLFVDRLRELGHRVVLHTSCFAIK